VRRFVFIGRLVREKGFQCLFPFFDAIVAGKVDAAFDVFGEGPIADEFLRRYGNFPEFSDYRNAPDATVLQVLSRIPENRPAIRFFGYRSHAAVDKGLRNADFCVMPSRFLETFGLSALESLSAGVPVVAVDKGGLSQFLFASGLKLADSHDSVEFSKTVYERLSALSRSSDGLVSEWRLMAYGVARRYSREIFQREISAILPHGAKKILLLTDFSGNIGGIETHVSSLRTILPKMGYEVRTVAKSLKGWGLWLRIRVTLAAFFNVRAAFQLLWELRRFRPDVVWCHSVLRRFGPVGLLPLLFVRKRPFLLITYHDLGYFAPIATAELEGEIPHPGFFSFVHAARGVFGKIAATAKWFKLAFLFRVLSKFNYHLVPSGFLGRFVKERVPKSKVCTVAHFAEST
jgi:glycosyltransferase involved in cell wall biosynthesis